MISVAPMSGRSDANESSTLTPRALFTGICIALGLTGTAHGQQQPSDAELEEVLVTGSRIVRRDFNAPSPILTVDAEVFQQTSNISLEYVLNQYPQFNPGATQFTTGEVQPTASTTPGASTLNMRGLGPSRSLVLLDGRRAQPVNAAMTVDVNTLPAAAIAGVEVISGGAAATYGPDAMAGVVNFRLRRDFEGIDLNYQSGWTDVGDGEETRIDGLIGGNFDGGRGNALFSLGYGRRELAHTMNREFYERGRDDPGTPANYARVDYPYWIPDSANLPSQDAVDQVLPVPGQSRSLDFYANPSTGSVFRLSDALNMGYDGPTGFPYKIRAHNGTLEQNSPQTWVSSPMRRTSAFGRALYELTDYLSVFVQGSHTHSTVEQLLFPSPMSTGFYVQRNPAREPQELRILLDSRPEPDADWRMVRVGYWFPYRGATTDTQVNEFVAGFEGRIPNSDWTWEIYHQSGRTDASTRMNNFVDLQRLEAIVAQPDYGRGATITVQAANDPVTRDLTCTSGIPVFEPFTLGRFGEVNYQSDFELSQDCIETITADMTQRNIIEQRVTEANVQGKLANMPAGELRGAFGLSNRVNYSLFEPDPLFVATTRAEGETEVSEIYGELLIPVIDNLDIELGARYSDFKTGDWGLEARSYKALINWAVTESFRFRGGWQRANRVPNVAELYAGQSSQVFWWTTGDACMTVTQHEWGNVDRNPNRAQVQELCRQLIYRSGGIPGQNDFDSHGADSYPNDGRALPFIYRLWTGGNARLRPELADTWTAGMVWQARNRDLTVSADWYEIEIDDVVGSLGFLAAYQQCFNFNGTSNPTYSPDNEFCQVITRDPVTAEPQFVYGGNFNLSRRYTSGVDMSINWSAPLQNFGFNGPGQISARTSLTKLLSWKQPQSQAPDAPMVQNAGYGTNFDYQLFTTFSYDRGPMNIGLNWRYMPEQPSGALINNPDATNLPTDAYNLFNLNGSWRFSENLRLRAGIDNLLDTDPPLTGRNPDHPTNPSNGLGITSAGNYDVLGRRYYLGMAVTF